MNKVHLQLLNRYQHSEQDIRNMIAAIWPAPYAKDAIDATILWGFDEPQHQIYLIYFDDEVVGITGFFDIDSHAGQAYLRWTGVIPEYRRRGIFKEAVRQLAAILIGANPSINRLIELVPGNEYGHTVAKLAFEAIGFKERKDLPVPVGEDDDWPCIPYSLFLGDMQMLKS